MEISCHIDGAVIIIILLEGENISFDTSLVMHINSTNISPIVIMSRVYEWRVWVRGGLYRVLLWKPEGRRPLGRPRRRWVDNIKMDLQEVGCGYVDWIGLAQDRDRCRTLVSAVMNLRVP